MVATIRADAGAGQRDGSHIGTSGGLGGRPHAAITEPTDVVVRVDTASDSMPSHCQTVGGIGWIFGHLIDGTQAESVRRRRIGEAVPANATRL